MKGEGMKATTSVGTGCSIERGGLIEIGVGVGVGIGIESGATMITEGGEFDAGAGASIYMCFCFYLRISMFILYIRLINGFIIILKRSLADE